MSPSTASTKSVCITLALLALTASPSLVATVAGDSSCDSCSPGSSDGFESATVIKRLPIHLPPLTEADDRDANDATTKRNSSMYGEGEGTIAEEGQFELPEELAAMIADAQSRDSSSPSVTPALSSSERWSDGVRYYATYSGEGESCSSKSTSSFEAWEESFDSLEDCCEVAFFWDYDSCMGL
mmetsp:Transcript_44200/g.94097  ORF Transcript_44200/g.94097 Transcript_44200/m.94097 type:complete len:183 (+) Transcript_44200:165-713(+)